MIKYLDFAPTITEKAQIKAFIEADAGLNSQEEKLLVAFDGWWDLHAPSLAKLP